MDKLDLIMADRRQTLYDQLLQCANAQLRLFTEVPVDEATELGAFVEDFLQLSQQWEQICAEIEDLDKKAETRLPPSPSLVALMEQIAETLQQIDQRLHASVNEAGSELKAVNNQRLVMNAYYGMNQKSQSSFYFDEKK
ncbi:hypothetical protein ACE3MQ_12255 [Paenibacillus lentus]|uniref:hypothetical protein n=1 Tax=Paenibacillus lentus TaxID=1338368 RepID=UPI00365F2CCE